MKPFLIFLSIYPLYFFATNSFTPSRKFMFYFTNKLNLILKF